jgi:hypothetical protein
LGRCAQAGKLKASAKVSAASGAPIRFMKLSLQQ